MLAGSPANTRKADDSQELPVPTNGPHDELSVQAVVEAAAARVGIFEAAAPLVETLTANHVQCMRAQGSKTSIIILT